MLLESEEWLLCELDVDCISVLELLLELDDELDFILVLEDVDDVDELLELDVKI